MAAKKSTDGSESRKPDGAAGSAKRAAAAKNTNGAEAKKSATASAAAKKSSDAAAETKKATSRRPKITHEMIAARAYLISLSEHAGTEVENWLSAERELLGK